MRYGSLRITTGKGISYNESEMQVMVWRDDSEGLSSVAENLGFVPSIHREAPNCL